MATTVQPRRLASDRSTPVVGNRADHSASGRFRRLRRDDGYVLAMVGLLIVPLVIVTAFATDVGQWYAQATKMQRTADAAALAGVVWIGDKIDPTRYSTEAQKVATQNGFANNSTLNGATVTVTVTKVPPNKLRVTINANAQVFFGRAGGVTTENLTRSAVAEFNLSVPLGSPRNFLGLGNLGSSSATYAGTPQEREGLWLAISGRCTDKAQGDRRSALTAKGGGTNNCSGTLNTEFSDTTYEFYIDLPTGRTYDTQVLIFNGNNSTDGSCAASATNPTGEFCPAGFPAGTVLQPTTFTLYRADSTPLDDTDNPTMAGYPGGGCTSNTAGINGTKTFAARTDGTGENNVSFNPGSGFSGSSTGAGYNAWWNMCTISQGAPDGRYIMRVRAQASTSGAAALTNGSNAYGIVANRTTSSALCDSRTDTQCPRVYAKDFLSVYATASGQPEFFLAEIGAEHAGKRVELTLWDPAEGASELRIKAPNGCGSGGGAWVDQAFDWSAPGTAGGTNVTSINVSAYSFNDKAVTITFRLPSNYSPLACNKWYRIRYTFGASATDRTTWELKILGDPVHLIE